jgi:hypothetical protein
LSNVPAISASPSIAAEEATRPPDPPRPLTVNARRRSWGEARVRPWWILGVFLLIVSVYFASTNITRLRRGRWLVEHGIKGQALLDRVGAEVIEGKRYAPDPALTVDMTITLPGRPPYTVVGRTLPDNREPLQCRTSIPIYVDPGDPNRFTTTTTFSIDIVLYLCGSLLLFTVFFLGCACFLRGRYLSLWKHGDAAVAVVVGTRQSPIAPFSRMVRCVLRDHKSGTVFSLLIPNRMGTPQPGDNLWIIVNLRRPSRVLLAGLYEQA